VLFGVTHVILVTLSPSLFAARIFCFVEECFNTLAPLLINFEDRISSAVGSLTISYS